MDRCTSNFYASVFKSLICVVWLQTKTQLAELRFLRATYEKCFLHNGEWLQADWALECTFLAICEPDNKKDSSLTPGALLFGKDRSETPAICKAQAEVQARAVGKFDASVNDSLRILTRGISALCAEYLRSAFGDKREKIDYADRFCDLLFAIVSLFAFLVSLSKKTTVSDSALCRCYC
jgi:hypothetical protein